MPSSLPEHAIEQVLGGTMEDPTESLPTEAVTSEKTSRVVVDGDATSESNATGKWTVSVMTISEATRVVASSQEESSTSSVPVRN